MKIISNKLYEEYTKQVISFNQYYPNITKEQLYDVFKFHCSNVRVCDETVDYIYGLIQKDKKRLEKLEGKND